MNKLKSIWTSLTGSLSSIIPLFFACCKSGACVGVCASPVASLFGISTAGFASSPLLGVLEPILIALSAVSFTISYYSIYVLPKYSSCNTNCNCDATSKSGSKEKISKIIFWVGLLASIFFFTYFEVQKYNANHSTMNTDNSENSSINCNVKDSLNSSAMTDTLENIKKPCCSENKECK